MKRNILQNDWRHVKVRVSGIWNRNPWSGLPTPGSLQRQGVNATLLPLPQPATGPDGHFPPPRVAPDEEREQLRTWEDEGGTRASSPKRKLRM